MIPVGLSQSINFFTGRYIGKNKVEMAKRISNLCMVVAWVWGFVSMALCWFGQDVIFKVYTHNEEIIASMKKAWYVLVVFVLFDCTQGVAAGNISGLGIMQKVKWVTAFDYWVLGIPLSLYMMFKANLHIDKFGFMTVSTQDSLRPMGKN